MKATSRGMDPATLAVVQNALRQIVDEMDLALEKAAFNPVMSESRDRANGIYHPTTGEVMAQGDTGLPIFVGVMQYAVQSAVAAYPDLGEGDVVILNDPYAGGTHLPDVTVVAPVFLAGERAPFGYVANRAHHADIGGGSPGSMPLATEIYQEGFRLPPVRIIARGRLVTDVLDLFLANTRIPEERRGDLLAQFAALRVGVRRLRELVERNGPDVTQRAMAALQDYSARRMSAALRRLPAGRYHAEDWMDDDGRSAVRIPIRVSVHIGRQRATIDFTGTSEQVAGGINANYAVTVAAVLYVFQSLAGGEIPANGGLMRPLRIIAPQGTLVNANFPAAVAGGNVETSQRIVDVMFKALASALPQRTPAASNGSMNNLSLGGYDPFRRRPFAYYETIAGGAGGGPKHAGASGVHTHMTNTLNTPIEALEAAYPLRITRYGLRPSSGGRGLHAGGDGIVREIEFLTTTQVTLLTERRDIPPYGLGGGGPGRTGCNLLITRGKVRRLPAKTEISAAAGERIRLLTPGGGGWGRRRRAAPPRHR